MPDGKKNQLVLPFSMDFFCTVWHYHNTFLGGVLRSSGRPVRMGAKTVRTVRTGEFHITTTPPPPSTQLRGKNYVEHRRTLSNLVDSSLIFVLTATPHPTEEFWTKIQDFYKKNMGLPLFCHTVSIEYCLLPENETIDPGSCLTKTQNPPPFHAWQFQ